MSIAGFVLRRLCGGLLLLLILSLLVFALLAASPGSPVQTLLGTRPATPELVNELRGRYHLDDPFALQYLHWLSDAVRLDFGRSITVQAGTPVADMVYGRTVLSAQLAVYCLLLVLLVGVPLGVAAGVRRGRTTDRSISLLATIGFGAPVYALSVVLLYVFGVALGWLPVYGAGEGFADRVTHLTLPAVALATVLSAVVIRQTRAATLTVMRQDYITFARLRGLSPGRVLIRYVLRNCAPPVVTSAGMLLVVPFSAGIFIEQCSPCPARGRLLRRPRRHGPPTRPALRLDPRRPHHGPQERATVEGHTRRDGLRLPVPVAGLPGHGRHPRTLRRRPRPQGRRPLGRQKRAS